MFVCIIDTFNLACLMYITKTGQVSKAAVYSTLNATFTIIFGLIDSRYEYWVIPYLVAIYFGYSLINYDKKVAAAKAARAKVRVRFVQRVEKDYEIVEKATITIGEDIDDEELANKISEFLYNYSIAQAQQKFEEKVEKQREMSISNIDAIEPKEETKQEETNGL